ncbi:MAG: PfkB family carbohydrate kinase [Peptostreptococcaceae bacterium]
MSTLVLGAAIVDKIMNMNSLPNSGDDICAESETTVVGGCAYNVSNILNNLEIEHDLVVPVGNGMYASAIERELTSDGHKIFIKDNEKDNGYCLCLVEASGERTFITVKGTECDFKKEWLDSLDTSKYNNVYISGYELEGRSGEVIVDFLEENKHMTIYFAPGPRITFLDKELLNRLYNLNPIVHLNDKEALEYTGLSAMTEAIKEIYLKSNNSVFLTVGPKGSLYIDNGNVGLIDGFKVDVVDTIGAGDSHIAGIIGARMLGYNISDSLCIANKIASKVVSAKGPKLDKNSFDKKEYLQCK